ncbi:hypothetical protein LguiA_010791 [Lonicera macranthoides]
MHTYILRTPPPPQLQLQTSSSFILLLQNRLLFNNTNNTLYSSQSLLTTLSVSVLPKSSSSLTTAEDQTNSSSGLPLKEEEEEEDDDDDEEEEEALISASQELFQLLEELKSRKHQSEILSLLTSFHFSDNQIKKLLIKYPKILQYNVNNFLKPKLQFLTDYGFAGPLLPNLIAAYPNILERSLFDCIIPRFEFLKKYLHTNDKLVAALKRSSRLMTCDLKAIVQPNIDFLLSEGANLTTVAKELLKQPRTLMMNPDKIVKAVETVKQLGLDPSARKFLVAVRVIRSMSDSTWDMKVQMFKSFGWSEEEITSAFKRYPAVFACSEEKIRTLMDFYLNTVNLNPDVIISYPMLLNYGLSTRILPRYNVMKVLKSKGLLDKDRKLRYLLKLSEEKFVTSLVDKHLDEVPNLMELYCGNISVDEIDIQLHYTDEVS